MGIFTPSVLCFQLSWVHIHRGISNWWPSMFQMKTAGSGWNQTDISMPHMRWRWLEMWRIPWGCCPRTWPLQPPRGHRRLAGTPDTRRKRQSRWGVPLCCHRPARKWWSQRAGRGDSAGRFASKPGITSFQTGQVYEDLSIKVEYKQWKI